MFQSKPQSYENATWNDGTIVTDDSVEDNDQVQSEMPSDVGVAHLVTSPKDWADALTITDTIG